MDNALAIRRWSAASSARAPASPGGVRCSAGLQLAFVAFNCPGQIVSRRLAVELLLEPFES